MFFALRRYDVISARHLFVLHLRASLKNYLDRTLDLEFLQVPLIDLLLFRLIFSMYFFLLCNHSFFLMFVERIPPTQYASKASVYFIKFGKQTQAKSFFFFIRVSFSISSSEYDSQFSELNWLMPWNSLAEKFCTITQ